MADVGVKGMEAVATRPEQPVGFGEQRLGLRPRLHPCEAVGFREQLRGIRRLGERGRCNQNPGGQNPSELTRRD
jgi:phage protein U